jgi:hypothetical protein
VSPLNWGLGHATRIIPIIHSLRALGARVWLASDGPVASLLAAEFPDLPMLKLEGYRIRYPGQGWLFIPSMLAQLPSLLNVISREKVWLHRMQRDFGWDMVISDNRYGLHHPDTRNILLTHQVYPRSGFALIPRNLLHRIHRRFMRPFDEIWIPDAAGSDNLSGALSHPPPAGISHRYIGPLSRFKYIKAVGVPTLEQDSYYLALLSGPEPQRSLFEKKILATMQGLDLPLVLVRGLPGQAEQDLLQENLMVYNHADPGLLSSLLRGAAGVVCRAGYSTVMDLVCLGKKALLVPTPGQTEQVYLAGYLSRRGYFPTMDQDGFSMIKAIDMLRMHQGIAPAADFTEYQRFLESLATEPGEHPHLFTRSPA